MKKTTIAILLLLALLLCGCGHKEYPITDGHGKRFERIYYDSATNIAVYVDMETGVEWARTSESFRPIPDSYGNPYIYPAFDAREDRLP